MVLPLDRPLAAAGEGERGYLMPTLKRAVGCHGDLVAVEDEVDFRGPGVESRCADLAAA